MLSDKEYYLKATKEFNEGNLDESLWAKVLTLAQGNEKKAKYTYIKRRAKILSRNQLSLKNLTKAVDSTVGSFIFVYFLLSVYLLTSDDFFGFNEYLDEFLIFFLALFVAPIVFVFLMSLILVAIFKPSNAIEFHKKCILTLTSIGVFSSVIVMLLFKLGY